jgi:acetoin utilization protein AcuC
MFSGGRGKPKAVFLHSAEMERHPYPPGHPFNTARAAKTRQILASIGMLGGEGRLEHTPQPASRAEMEKFHTPEYLDALVAASDGRLDMAGFMMGLGTGDCPVFEGLYEYASLACGATLTGAGLILSGQASVAFNPSGGYHHAHAARASGFCYVNDVALACMVLAEQAKRVLYVDVDVHHGDGVQAAFYHRKDVMTVSLHESGRTQFPGTGFENEIGTGEGVGYSVNVPLPMWTYDEAYLRAFKAVALPLAGQFDPDVIVLELGMDALAGDPLGHLSLTNNAHAEVIELLRQFDRPILATGGGGYHVENTARGWALGWCVLCGCGKDTAGHGLGGDMPAGSQWQGSLQDRPLVPSAQQRAEVDAAVDAAIEAVKANVFGIHGL